MGDMVQVSKYRAVQVVGGGEIEVRRGIMSRTGMAIGHVDEGLCVQISAKRGDNVLSIERLYAPDVFDPAARNTLGALGAYCDQEPAQQEIDAAVERARVTLATGERSDYSGLKVRCVAAA